jgi:NAD(P)-dependent dehydrogenase (short-subunit alcohol dehydrogenase family)
VLLTDCARDALLQVAARTMLAQGGGGRIVIIGSVMADMAAPGSSTYSSSKAAIRQLGRTMANELGKEGITVNTIQVSRIILKKKYWRRWTSSNRAAAVV